VWCDDQAENADKSGTLISERRQPGLVRPQAMFNMRGHPCVRQLRQPLGRGNRQVVPASRVAFKAGDVSNQLDAQVGRSWYGFLSMIGLKNVLEHNILFTG
jgi:hypothetical protein